MDQDRDADLKCPICGAAHATCGGPAKLKNPPIGWEGEWIASEDSVLVTSIRRTNVSAGDFIAEDDIFIDAQGNVVEKKDAQTKLASKGARVSPADVEKYGLQAKTQTSTKDDGEGNVLQTKMMEPAQTRQKKTRAGESAKESAE
jgi:hypothetical protein